MNKLLAIFKSCLLIPFLIASPHLFAQTAEWTTTGCDSDDSPFLLNIMIDACNPSLSPSDEGLNEFVIFQTGDIPYDVNSEGTGFVYGCDEMNLPINAWSQVSAYTSNPAYVATLNAATSPGCMSNVPGPVFIDAMAPPTNGNLPPDALVWAFNSPNPSETFAVGYFDDLCGAFPVYVIFGNAPPAAATGVFKNYGCNPSPTCPDCLRHIHFSFGGCTFEVSYNVDNLVNAMGLPGGSAAEREGAYISLNPGGEIGYLNDGNLCAPPPTFCTPPDEPIITISNPITICQGDPIPTFTCSNCDGNTAWYTNITDVSPFLNAPSYTPMMAGTWYVENIVDCASQRIPVTLNIDPAPPITLSASDQAPCVGDVIDLNSGGVDDPNILYFWTITLPSGSELMATGVDIVDFDISEAGGYIISVEAIDLSGSGCNNFEEEIDFIIAGVSPTADFNFPATLCANEDLVLDATVSTNADPGASYQWLITHQGGASQMAMGPMPTFTGLAAGFYNLTLLVTNSPPANCSDILSLTNALQVLAAPDLVQQGSSPIVFECAAPHDLNASVLGGDGSGTWSGGAFISAAGLFDPSGLAAGNYVVTYTEGTAPCDDMIDITVVVNDAPPEVVLTTNAASFCESGNMVDLTIYVDATSIEGTWSGTGVTGNMFDPSVGNTVLTFTANCNFPPMGGPCPGVVDEVCGCDGVTYNNACEAEQNGGVYSYSPGVCMGGVPGGCPPDTETLTITINPDPTVTIVDPGDLCADSGIETLSANTDGGVWSGSAAIDAMGNFDTSVGMGDYDITYTFTDVNMCTNSDMMTITVNPSPMPSITDPGVLCANTGLVALSASPSGGIWGGDADILGNIDTDAGGGNYNVTYTITDLNICMGTASLNITISPNPTVTITDPGTLCANTGLVALSANPAGGTWGGSADAAGNLGTNAGMGVYNVTYSFTNGNMCTTIENLDITVADEPTVTITDPGTLCANAGIVAIAASPAGGIWSGTIDAMGNFNTALGMGMYNISYTFSNGDCDGTADFTVEVADIPTVTITNPGDLCVNSGNFSLNGTPVGGVWSGSNVDAAGNFDTNTGVNSYDVTYTFTDVNMCEGSETVTINVVAEPIVSITNPGDLCVNSGNFSLNGTPVGGVWSGSNVDAAGNFDTNAGVNSYDVTYTFTDSNMCEGSETVTINVVTEPIVSITNPGNLCVNSGNFSLNGTPVGGVWSGSNVDAAGNFDTNAGVNSYDVTYTFTDSNMCEGSETVTINVVAEPMVSITNPGNLCVNSGNFSLNGTPVGGVWSGSNVDASGNFDTNAGVNSYDVTYTFTDSNMCEGSETVTINVVTEPMVSITNPGDLCVNSGNFSLNGTPVGGVWSGSNVDAAGNFDTNTGVNSYDVTYTFTDANMCEGSEMVTINVVALPTVNINNPGTLCEDDPIQMLVANPVGGNWGGDVAMDGSFNPTTAGEGMYSATYTFTDANDCTNSASVNFAVTVCTVPCEEDASINPPPALCGEMGVVFDLNTLVTGDAGGTWTTDAPAGTISLGAMFNANGLSGDFTITYTVTGADTCPDEMQSQTISIVAPPDASTNLLTNELCNTTTNTTIDLNTLVTGDAGGVWTSATAPGAVDGTGIFNASGLAQGVYEVTYTVNATAPCTGQAETSQNIQVIAPLLVIADAVTCDNEVELNSGGAGAGSWSVTAGNATIANTLANSTTATLNDGIGGYTFEWTPDVADPCLDIVTVAYDFLALPMADAGADDALCGFVTTLNAADTGNGTWTYTGVGIATIDDLNDPNSMVSVDTYGAYIFTWTVSELFCENSDAVEIVFYPETTVDPTPLDPTPEEVCGDTYNLSPYILSVGGGGTTEMYADTLQGMWVWTGPMGANVVFMSDEFTPNVTVTVDMYGLYTFNWILTDPEIADENCGSGVANSLQVNFIEPLMTNINTVCSPDFSTYTLEITVSGGTAPYTANGSGFGGSIYTETFNNLENYDITIDDSSICPPVNESGTEDCTCPSPDDPVSDGDVTHCDDGTPFPSLSVMDNGIDTYNWYDSETSTSIINIGPSFNTPPGIWWVEAVSPVGCVSLNRIPIELMVIDIPPPPMVSADLITSACEGPPPPDFVATPTAGGTITWYTDAALTMAIETGTTFTAPAPTPGTTDTYWVTETVEGCEGAPAMVTWEMQPCFCPTILDLVGGAAACSGELVPLNATIEDLIGNVDRVEWISSGTQAAGDDFAYVATETVTGCDPLTVIYTFNVYCVEDPTVPSDNGTLEVTFYPIPDATTAISNGGCTLTATPTCPNFSITSPNPLTATPPDMTTATFTIQNEDAAAAGIACTADVSEDFNCMEMTTCPILLNVSSNIAQACSGNNILLNVDILDTDNLLDRIEWTDADGTIVGNLETVTVSETTAGCNIELFEYTVTIFCTDNPAIPVGIATIEVGFTPEYNPSILAFAQDCENLPTLTTPCPNYVVTPIMVNPPLPGMNTATWEVSYVGTTCFTEIVSFDYDCSDCPTVVTPAAVNVEICDGDTPDFATASAMITIDDPGGFFDEINWYAEPALSNEVQAGNYAHSGLPNSCGVQMVTLYAGVVCTLNPDDPIPAGTMEVIIYPNFNANLVTATSLECEVPTLVTACANYIITPVDVPTVVNPGENGVATWNIAYNGGPGGVSCINQDFEVAYTCDACPIAVISQSTPESMCNNESITVAIEVTPADAIIDVDYSVQWLINGFVIPNADENVYSSSIATTGCDPQVNTYSVMFTCLNPGSPPVSLNAGTVSVFPDFSPAFVNFDNTDCQVPEIDLFCANYMATPISVPVAVGPGDSGTATWQVDDIAGCFSEEVSVTYDCPALGCPTVTNELDFTLSVCDGGMPDFAVAITNIGFDDPNGTLAQFEWFSDPALTIAGVPAFYNHSGADNCATESVTVYVGLLCTESPDPIPAGSLTIDIYPTPPVLNPVGDCSLEVIDPCGGALVVEYSDDSGFTWVGTPNAMPLNDETWDWRAYLIGTPDEDMDGNPDCFINGTVTAECPCIPPLPPMPIVVDVTTCEGDLAAPLEVLLIEGDAVVWYDDPVGTDVIHEGQTFVPTASGTYYFEAIVMADGCVSDRQEANYTLLPLDDATFSYADANYCLDDPNPLPNMIALPGGVFSANNGLGIDPVTGEIFINALVTDGIFTITYLTTGDCPDSTLFDIFVTDCTIPCPTVNIAADADIELCDLDVPDFAALEATIDFTDTDGTFTGFLWYSDNTLMTPVSPADYAYTGDNCSVFTTTIYVGLLCNQTPLPFPAGSIDITVYPMYDATLIMTTSNDCEVPTVTTTCADYILTPQPDVPLAVLPGESGTATWEVTYNSALNCFTETVEVDYACPTCPTVTGAAAGIFDLCEAEMPDFAAITTAVAFDDPDGTFDSFAWYSDAALTTLLSPADYAHSGACAVESFMAYAGLICTLDPAIPIFAGEITLNVYPTPTTVTAVGDCSLEVVDNCGDVLIIEYLQADGTWGLAPNPDPINGETVDWRAYVAGAPDNDMDGTADCMQTGTATAECDCIAPDVPTSILTELTVCEGTVNETAFEVSVNAGEEVIWLDETNMIVANGTTFVPTLPGTYVANALNPIDGCVSDPITATLTLVPLDDATFAFDQTVFCPTDANPLPLGLITTGGTFTTDGSLAIDPLTGLLNLASVTQGGDFTITYTTGGLCPDTSSQTITIEPLINLSVTGITTINQGESTQLTATGGTSYTWDDDPTLDCIDCADPIASPFVTTTYFVAVSDNCSAPVSITVLVLPDTSNKLIVPNAFSPNDDGVNDIFRAVYQGTLVNFSMIIYNRWGEQLFLTNDPTDGWDGTYKGQKLELGVYSFAIRYQFAGENERVEVEAGNVTLIW